jgi:hypothetical protein
LLLHAARLHGLARCVLRARGVQASRFVHAGPCRPRPNSTGRRCWVHGWRTPYGRRPRPSRDRRHESGAPCGGGCRTPRFTAQPQGGSGAVNSLRCPADAQPVWGADGERPVKTRQTNGSGGGVRRRSSTGSATPARRECRTDGAPLLPTRISADRTRCAALTVRTRGHYRAPARAARPRTARARRNPPLPSGA